MINDKKQESQMRFDLPEGAFHMLEEATFRFDAIMLPELADDTYKDVRETPFLDYARLYVFDEIYDQLAPIYAQRAFAYLIHYCGKEIQAALDASERKIGIRQSIHLVCDDVPVELIYIWERKNQKQPHFCKMHVNYNDLLIQKP